MKIKLQTLILRNFKGVEYLKVDFSENTNILGANESGKSTLCTAFNWLLTGKDEFDRKDYEIKNTKKPELNDQPHEVEGIFTNDGRELKLKRVYLEDWVKPRGMPTKVFEGHYTEYYENDVKRSAKEYQTAVDSIIPANLIKLLTNPIYFNTLNWADQRRGLLSIAGNISNTDIIDTIATPQNDFGALINALNDPKYKGVEDYRKHIQTEKKLLKDKAMEFQPRIQEVLRNMPKKRDWLDIEAAITLRKIEIKAIDETMADFTKGLKAKQEGITMLQKEVFAAEQKITAIRNKIQTEQQAKLGTNDTEIATLRSKIKASKGNIAQLRGEVTAKQNNIKGYNLDIERLDKIIAGHRNKWSELNARVFEFDEEKCNCPTCKQALPVQDVEQMKANMLANFNKFIADDKADEVAKSDVRKEERAKQLAFIASAEEAIAGLENEAFNIHHNILDADEDTLTSLLEVAGKNTIPDINLAVDILMDKNGDVLNLRDEIRVLQDNITKESAETDNLSGNFDLKEKRQRLLSEIEEFSKQLGDRDTIEKMEIREQELLKEEEANAQKIAQLERQEFEIETFIRAKMDILESRVNSMFHHVSFRLFHKQVNGGIDETCVCEYNEVPYPTLNTAAKMLAGLDVIETFSKYHGIHAPVFCDNRESVSFIPEINSQIISLFVSPAHTTLKVEAA